MRIGIIDGKKQDKSLFKMIKIPFEKTPDFVLSAYKDNAAVMEGSKSRPFLCGSRWAISLPQ